MSPPRELVYQYPTGCRPLQVIYLTLCSKQESSPWPFSRILIILLFNTTRNRAATPLSATSSHCCHGLCRVEVCLPANGHSALEAESVTAPGPLSGVVFCNRRLSRGSTLQTSLRSTVLRATLGSHPNSATYSAMTLGKSLNFSGILVPHLHTGEKSSTYLTGYGKVPGSSYLQREQHLA